MISNQKHKFKLPENVTYLNGAFMSPFLKEVERVGHESVTKKCFPFEISGDDFFTNTKILKQTFAKLVDVNDYQNIAIIPSVSYGISTVTNTIVLEKDDEILVVDEQFPSNIYAWKKLTRKYKAKIITVKAPMLIKSIEQLITWQPKNIQDYCKEITKDAIKSLQNLGCFIEDEGKRSSHLFGVYLPENSSLEKLKIAFKKNNIFVSFRGNSIRISPNVYNTKEDFNKLVHCFKDALKL